MSCEKFSMVRCDGCGEWLDEATQTIITREETLRSYLPCQLWRNETRHYCEYCAEGL